MLRQRPGEGVLHAWGWVGENRRTFEHPVECSGVICDNVPWRVSNALTLFFNKLPERTV